MKTNVYSMEDLISLGLDAEVKKFVRNLLNVKPPLEIVQEKLIPALDKVGADFEKGKLFLPQLIRSADCAGACFDVIKSKMKEESSVQESNSQGRCSRYR